MKTIGFLSMRFEKEEKRDFRPGFFKKLSNLDKKILLDHDYGKKLGYDHQAYLENNAEIRFVSRGEVLKSDSVVTVRTPELRELELLKPGSSLFSMLHFVTHSARNKMLTDMGIRMFAMDSVVDDFGLRMIQDFPGTVRTALFHGFNNMNTQKIDGICRVLVIGSGELGKLAVDYSIHMSPMPTIANCIGRRISIDKSRLIDLLKETDVLIDTSKRIETHEHIIANDLIGILPEHAVIIDISADDYDTSIFPNQVKGIEGIPTGNLGQYVFDVDDPAYERIPPGVSSLHRRKLISCYSWPGVDPIQCLDRYETQIVPFIRVIGNLERKSPLIKSTNLYERALLGSSYNHFLRKLKKTHE